MDNLQEFELLAKLLNNTDLTDNKKTNEFKSLFMWIKEKLQAGFYEIANIYNLENKEKILMDIDYILEKEKAVLNYPNFINSNIIGVMFDSIEGGKKVFEDILLECDSNDDNLSEYDSFNLLNVPRIYINKDIDGESVSIINKQDTIVPLSIEEFSLLENKLNSTQNFRLEKFIKGITQIKFFVSDATIIMFPSDADKYSELYKSMIRLTDSMLIETEKNNCKSLKYLKSIGYDKEALVIGELENKEEYKNLIIRDGDDFLYDICVSREGNRFLLKEKIDNILTKVSINLKMEQKKLLVDMQNLKSGSEILKSFENIDLVKSNLLILKEEIREIWDSNKKALGILESLKSEVYELSSKFLESLSLPEKTSMAEWQINFYTEYIKNLIDNDEGEKAKILIQKFKKGYYREAILSQYYRKKIEGYDDKHKWTCTEGDDNVALMKIKIDLDKCVDDELEEYISKLKKVETSKEYFLKGKYLFDKDDFINAEKNLLTAFEMGYSDAAVSLENIYLKNISGEGEQLGDEFKKFEYLAELGNLSSFDFCDDEFHLKIGASIDRVDFINRLGNRMYKQKNYVKASEFYERSLSLCSDDKVILQRLGATYYKQKKYQKAELMFEKSGNKEALYSLGTIYKIGAGRMIDYNKALEFYGRAMELGDQDAEKAYLKLKNEIENKENQNKDYESYNYNSDYSDVSGEVINFGKHFYREIE